MAKTKRSSTIRKRFLTKHGLKMTPRGKEIAHRKPLVLGGKDDLRNLMLKKKSTHKRETKKLLRKLTRRHK